MYEDSGASTLRQVGGDLNGDSLPSELLRCDGEERFLAQVDVGQPFCAWVFISLACVTWVVLIDRKENKAS